MIIPWQDVNPDTLLAIIESVVLREGTDYGAEFSLEQKVQAVQQQLSKGTAHLVFDPETESLNILTTEQISL